MRAAAERPVPLERPPPRLVLMGSCNGRMVGAWHGAVAPAACAPWAWCPVCPRSLQRSFGSALTHSIIADLTHRAADIATSLGMRRCWAQGQTGCWLSLALANIPIPHSHGCLRQTLASDAGLDPAPMPAVPGPPAPASSLIPDPCLWHLLHQLPVRLSQAALVARAPPRVVGCGQLGPELHGAFVLARKGCSCCAAVSSCGARGARGCRCWDTAWQGLTILPCTLVPSVALVRLGVSPWRSLGTLVLGCTRRLRPPRSTAPLHHLHGLPPSPASHTRLLSSRANVSSGFPVVPLRQLYSPAVPGG